MSQFSKKSHHHYGDPSRGGTVLMEAVLCLPLLLFLVTGIVQFARIWEARLMTRHAAYNAARATLVYRTSDYANTNSNGRVVSFNTHGGAAWLAAVNTLAWKSSTHHATKGASANYVFPGFEGDASYRIDSSAFIRDQVRIRPEMSWERNGMVRVTVHFRFPLLFSLFALGSMSGFNDNDDIWKGAEVPLVHQTDDDIAPRMEWSHGIPHILLTESCVMPKPWSTCRYPSVSGAESEFLEMKGEAR